MAKNIFAFCNQKGGVGKTTTVINIAAQVSQSQYKTLVIDMDSQSNLTSGLGIERPETELTSYQLFVDNSDPRNLVKPTEFENLFLIPSNHDLAGVEIELTTKIGREFALKNQLDKIAGEYDYVFIDCPPSLGLMTVNALTTSRYIFIPLQCEYYAMEGLGQLLNTHQLIQKNLNAELQIGGVLLTMADFRTNLTQQVIEEVRTHFKDTVFQTVIPRSVKLSEAPSFGKPAIFYDQHNRGAKSYMEAGNEFLARFPAGNKNNVIIEKPQDEIHAPEKNESENGIEPQSSDATSSSPLMAPEGESI